MRLSAISADSPRVYVGTSAVDFSPLGVELTSPEVLAQAGTDGVGFIFDPTVDHGHVVAAVTGAEELTGTWYLNSRLARAKGTLRMRRTQPITR